MTSLAFAAPRRSIRVSARRQGHAHRARRRSRATRTTTWETRSFVAAAASILVAFVLALAYLASSTSVATTGYEAERLRAQRDEIRRQNALLELELARLDSPGRIESAAKRLGLVHVAYIPVVPATTLIATR